MGVYSWSINAVLGVFGVLQGINLAQNYWKLSPNQYYQVIECTLVVSRHSQWLWILFRTQITTMPSFAGAKKHSWEGPCQTCQFLHVLPCRKEEVAARELWWWYSSNYKTIGIILWHTSFKCTHPFIAILEYLIKPEYPISWYYSSEGQFPIIRPFLANCMP